MDAAFALNRFGLGARPDEAIPEKPEAWLLEQLDRYDPRPRSWSVQRPSAKIIEESIGLRRAAAEARGKKRQVARRAANRLALDSYNAAVTDRAFAAIETSTPFVERLVHFWANHFAISGEKGSVRQLSGAYEVEAIRPHVLGRFEDMLVAAEQHPAMGLYLDQTRSVGEASPEALRHKKRKTKKKLSIGLNENLGREVMELHTLGAQSGYSQADVTEFARAITGWTVGGYERGPVQDPARLGAFYFHPGLHEPGVRQVLGKSYAQTGEAQGLALLRDFARSPATARHIATKLARHFISDDPPPEVIEHLARTYLSTDGDLPAVYRALVEVGADAAAGTVKFKTPWEWLISSLRAMGLERSDSASFVKQTKVAVLMRDLGQRVWWPGSPAGFADTASNWLSSEGLWSRARIAQDFVGMTGRSPDPRELAAKVLPGSLSDSTREAVGRAESLSNGLALLLMSPEFLRRS
ncbi:DUF1800 domain-containing protein [Novosphingobium mangrovi (ex Hu et al. 2023)]|uniref:DUF1800 domain-containing protein n=1 Tax=Novosphingobium mangrovi (ex Hu et al. 2023) TaxID=2930094 RepID=A0ABT0AC99_9SPHN|nr:DUF1800 domain-containing protein [Novosphingobium mangrovi (ex Hu et al. 2023)]MCJ1960823.1 DUF1800 domain-containing protein [Novosphingobium mangrovi (ex Hu et al. 2023)]